MLLLKKLCVFLVVSMLCFNGGSVSAEETAEETIDKQALLQSRASARAATSISNGFITASLEEVGFGVGLATTGGDPADPTDDNTPLVFGGTAPDTSYDTYRAVSRTTTVGGVPDPFDVATVTVAPTAVDASTVVAAVEIIDVTIEKKIEFTSVITGRPDTVRVTWTATNKSTQPRNVAIRSMIDTLVGANDGVTIVLLDDNSNILVPQVETEYTATSDSGLPLQWYSLQFDAIAAPGILLEGNHTGNGATPPDRVGVVNWPRVYGSFLNFPTGVTIGNDIAYVMLWDEVPIAPGDDLVRVFYMGLAQDDAVLLTLPTLGFWGAVALMMALSLALLKLQRTEGEL